MANNDTKLRITADATGAQLAFRSLEQSVGGVTKKFFEFNGLAATLGGALSLTAFAGFVKKSVDLQDSLAILSEKTGTTVEALAGLKYAAEQNDTSLEAVANSAKKLSVNLSASPDLFRKLGITAKDTTGAMIQLSDLFASMPDGVTKSALAVKLMGKSGEEMIPLMNQGGDSLRKFIEQGQKIYPVTTENANAAREFNDQMKALSAEASGFGIQLSNVLLPGLVETTTKMNALAQAGHPVLALWQALGGMGKIPWDMLIPPESLKKSLSSDGMLKDLQVQIGNLERQKQGTGGKLLQMIFGTPDEIDSQIRILNNQIDTIKKHAAELDKPTPAAAAKQKTIPKSVTDLLAKGGIQGSGIVSNLETDYKNSYEKKLRDLDASVISSIDKQFIDNLAEVSIKASKAREEIDKLDISKEKHKELTNEVNKVEKEQLSNMEALRAKTEELNASWEHGAKVSLRNYMDEAANTSKQTETLFTNAFKNAEDAAVSFIRTAKFDFSSLVDSIINDLIRMQVKSAESGIMDWFLGLGHYGVAPQQSAAPVTDITVPSAKGNVFGFANGGAFTNSIFGSPTMFKFASGGGFNLGVMGEAGPEAVMPLTRGKNGKLGVVAQGGGVTVTYAPTIHIDSRTDQAEVQKLVAASVQQGNAELVDMLHRNGSL